MSTKNIIYSLTILSCLLLINVIAIGQPINNQIGDVTLPSADATAFGKFAEIPATGFNGTPAIGIPLTTITQGPLNLPISLSYNASGVKVAELASWVGLGWTLNATNMVSRSIIGIPDESTNGWFNLTDLNTLFLDEIANGNHDSEPDMFSFNIGGYSGKFIFPINCTTDPDIEAFIIPRQDVKITRLFAGSTFTGIKIITPDGVAYHFGTGPNGIFRETNEIYPSTNTNVTGWYMTKIESHDQKHQILFDYDAEEYLYKNAASAEYVNTITIPTSQCGTSGNSGPRYLGPYNSSTSTSHVKGWRIKNITNSSSTQSVDFNVSSVGRDDLTHFGSAIPKSLASIDIYHGADFDKQYEFAYTYWHSPTDPNDVSGGTTNTDPHYKRLRLETVIEKPLNGTATTTSPYEFEYEGNLDALPHRLSRSVDHWGFYNGQTNNLTVNVPPSMAGGISYGSANRNTSETHMLNGVLNKITYPTKGYTEYNYGANRYLYPIEESSTMVELSHVESCPFTDPTCCGMPTATGSVFTLTQDDLDYGIVNVQLLNGGGSCYTSYSNLQVFVKDANTNNIVGGWVWGTIEGDDPAYEPVNSTGSIAQLLPGLNTPGDYYLDIWTFNGFGSVKITTPEADELDVGGLRSEHIITYDRDGQIKNESIFDYTHASSSESSGVLYTRPIYSSVVEKPGLFYLASFRDMSVVPLGSFDGYHIGYTRVVEIKPGNGHTEYLYNVESRIPVTTYPQIPDLYLAQNGRSEGSTVFREGSTSSIRETVNTYNGSTYVNFPTIPAKIFKSSLDNAGTTCHYIKGQVYQIRTGHSLISSSSNTLDGLTTNTTYDYVFPYQFPIKTTVTNSDNIPYSTLYFYANTYPAGSIKNKLLEQNRFLPAWKTRQTVNNQDVDGTQTIFSFFDAAGNPTGSTSDQLYPHDIERYEATFSGGTPSGSWQNQYTIEKYQLGGSADVGMPKEINTFGWSDPIELTWDDDINMTQWKYKDFIKKYTYHNNSNLVKTFEDIDGIKKEYDYDGLIRPSQIIDRFGSSEEVTTDMTYSYGTQNKVNIDTDFGTYSIAIEKIIDGLGRDIQVIQKNHNNTMNGDVSSTIAYDNVGRKLSETDPRGLVTTYSYYPSPLGRVHTITNNANLASQTIAYSSGNPPISGYSDLYIKTVTDQDERITETYTDKIGRQVVSASGKASNLAYTIMDYDDKSRVEKIHPPGGFNIANLMYNYTYDGDDNILTKKMPDKGIMQYQYDNRNLPIAMNDANIVAEGEGWLNTEYDDYGRPSKIGFGTSPGTVSKQLIKNYYDGNDTDNMVTAGITVGKLHKKTVNILNGFTKGNEDLSTTYTFDPIGRLFTETSEHHMGASTNTTTYMYDGADNIKKVTKNVNGIPSETIHTYDAEGRLRTSNFSANGSTTETISNIIEYSDADDILEKVVGAMETCNFAYNNMGWLTAINPNDQANGSNLINSCPTIDPTGMSNRLFSMNLGYNTGSNPESSGNIAQQTWKVYGREQLQSDYIYDHLSRITNSTTNPSHYNTSYTYEDDRGNIGTITRDGLISDGNCFEAETIDNLTFGYVTNSNKISNITDTAMNGEECPDYYHVGGQATQSGTWGAEIELSSDAEVMGYTQTIMQAEQMVELKAGFEFTSDGTGTFLAHIDDCATANPNLAMGDASAAGFTGNGGTYQYDGNGNMIVDPNKGFTFEYNHLNLPYLAQKDANNKIDWLYTAEGQKLQKLVTDENLPSPNKKDYLGEYEFTDDNLEAVYHSEGRVAIVNSTNEFQYNLRDHLGNTRVVFKKNGGNKEIIQESHYYPFGMQLNGAWNNIPDINNDYLYNGKELNKDLALGLSDYGARFYDPSIGRWTGVDPQATKYSHASPYVYVANMPTKAIDPNGEEIIIVNNSNAAQVIQDLGKIYATRRGRALLDKLARSNTKYYIDGSGKNILSSGYNRATNTIKYTQSTQFKDGVNSTSVVLLGHELVHAEQDEDRPWMLMKIFLDTKWDKEKEAMRFENYLRDVLNLGSHRLKHGGKLLLKDTNSAMSSGAERVDINSVNISTEIFGGRDATSSPDGDGSAIDNVNQGTSIAPMMNRILEYMDQNGLNRLEIDFTNGSKNLDPNRP